MALPDKHDLVGSAVRYADAVATAQRRSFDAIEAALVECGLPVGPCVAYLERSFCTTCAWWAAWHADPWSLTFGETRADWIALRATGVVGVVVRFPNGERVMRQGKDPFYWDPTLGPRDAKFGLGVSDGVPTGIDPTDVKDGVWVTDAEMALVRWISATLRFA